jgi:hypothetical protein
MITYMTITEYIRNVDRAILNTVFQNTVQRVNKCLETGGGHFDITCNFPYCNNQVHRDFLSSCITIHGAKNIKIPSLEESLRLCLNHPKPHVSLCSAREVTRPTAKATYWLGVQPGTILRTKDEDALLIQIAFMEGHYL